MSGGPGGALGAHATAAGVTPNVAVSACVGLTHRASAAGDHAKRPHEPSFHNALEEPAARADRCAPPACRLHPWIRPRGLPARDFDRRTRWNCLCPNPGRRGPWQRPSGRRRSAQAAPQWSPCPEPGYTTSREPAVSASCPRRVSGSGPMPPRAAASTPIRARSPRGTGRPRTAAVPRSATAPRPHRSGRP